MSEYTPTTEQVRDFWASDGKLQPAAKSYDYAKSGNEFDRWLQSERARIWDEGAEYADENWFWHDVGRHSNPYRAKEDA